MLLGCFLRLAKNSLLLAYFTEATLSSSTSWPIVYLRTSVRNLIAICILWLLLFIVWVFLFMLSLEYMQNERNPPL